MKKHNPISYPKHYTFSVIEVIDAIEAWGLPYHLGNAVKYIARAGRKSPKTTVQDLQKASWYLNRYIDRLKTKSGVVILAALLFTSCGDDECEGITPERCRLLDFKIMCDRVVYECCNDAVN